MQVGLYPRSPQESQAVQSVYDDYKLTRKALEEVAETIREPESMELKNRDLKRINFRTHNYFMLFRIQEDRVEITNIYHGLEDFKINLDRQRLIRMVSASCLETDKWTRGRTDFGHTVAVMSSLRIAGVDASLMLKMGNGQFGHNSRSLISLLSP